MANFIKGLFVGAKPSAVPVASVDTDFADYVDAPSPTPVVSSTFSSLSSSQTLAPTSPGVDFQGARSVSDFYVELFVVPLIILAIVLHIWGSSKNRDIAKRWMTKHRDIIEAEYADFGLRRTKIPAEELGHAGLYQERAKHTFLSYATGRQNVAFMDIKLELYKRYNPLTLIGEQVIGFFFESMPAPVEKVEMIAFPFDGKEAQLIPSSANNDTADKQARASVYDGFVWAVVHRDSMKQLRDERFDLSITSTREHNRLPDWAITMTEAAEITETLLTPDLAKAIEACGDDFEALIVSDMPLNAPKTLTDLIPKKSLALSLRLSKNPERAHAVINQFLRLPDLLVSSARFRPEVMRRVKTTRDDIASRMRKVEDDAKAEERKTGADKAKKEERDRKLKAMKPDEQRKFLEKERERDNKKRQGKRTIKA